MDHVPVGRPCDRHLRNAEVLVQRVQCSRGSGAAGNRNCGARLEHEDVAVAVEDAVEEGEDPPAGMRIIGRRREHEAVRFSRFGDKVVHAVAF